jgi:hypothetical protein
MRNNRLAAGGAHDVNSCHEPFRRRLARWESGREKTTMPPVKLFRGTSKTGNVQKALDLAIKAAQQSATGADRLVEWTLKQVSGRQGGIAGFHETTVVIKAKIS